MEKSVLIKSSLDARQAAEFVQAVSKFDSEVQIAIEEKKINAKSIMGMIALNMQGGQTATIITTGADEEMAAIEVEKLLV
ncbi:MAG: HPr family phosphocarrier protein [Bacillota bacterium]